MRSTTYLNSVNVHLLLSHSLLHCTTTPTQLHVIIHENKVLSVLFNIFVIFFFSSCIYFFFHHKNITHCTDGQKKTRQRRTNVTKRNQIKFYSKKIRHGYELESGHWTILHKPNNNNNIKNTDENRQHILCVWTKTKTKEVIGNMKYCKKNLKHFCRRNWERQFSRFHILSIRIFKKCN